MTDKKLIKTLIEILIEDVDYSSGRIAELGDLDFAPIALNEGMKMEANKILELIYKYKS